MHDASGQKADAPPHGRDIAYRAAADRYWVASGSTSPDLGTLAHRRATRTSAGQPLNLTVYDLALDHDASLEDFARAHGRPEDIPAGRTALAAYAAAIAVRHPETAAEYETRQLASSLQVALTLGDSDDALGRISCPKCLCWSLVPSRGKGRWRAECCNLRCAHDPDPVHDQGDTEPPAAGRPRRWTLERIAAHHLADRYPRTA
ncbi:hypothetical protein [Streptomyces cavernae]|uniref:hypothetical protein n=1 Tax=Streptomyces cavernae TaxID=2259034 RepID=UPI000FEB78EE|nr:hypothetical protein [Streptomyces cavernae]